MIAILPYAVPVLEERLHAQEVCKICTNLHPVPLAAAHAAVCAVQEAQGEQSEELKVLLLHLMTEIIAQAGKVGPRPAFEITHNQQRNRKKWQTVHQLDLDTCSIVLSQ